VILVLMAMVWQHYWMDPHAVTHMESPPTSPIPGSTDVSSEDLSGMEEVPKVPKLRRAVMTFIWIWVLLGVLSLLAARYHYTIDIIIAAYAAHRTWIMYGKMNPLPSFALDLLITYYKAMLQQPRICF